MFSCPRRDGNTQYSISSKAWNKRMFCSRLCAAKCNAPIHGIRRRGSCSEKTLQQLRDLAKARIGTKREPFSTEWKDNLSKSHIGIPSPLKGKKKPQQSGEKHPNWKGGITPEIRKLKRSIEWKEWRESVFTRDNFRCLDCGFKGYIEPHHIVPIRSDRDRLFDTNNGITLCRPCHVKTFRKESMFASVYFSLAARAV